jgi:monothiol glutaredoxin
MSTMTLNESLRKQIFGLLASNRVVLFMKGTRQMPQCGFSAQVVQILNKLLPSYETVDVLDSPQLRDGIKEFSQWPSDLTNVLRRPVEVTTHCSHSSAKLLTDRR